MGVSKTIQGPSSNGTNVTMVKEIEFHVTERYVEVSTAYIMSLDLKFHMINHYVMSYIFLIPFLL